MTNQTTAAAEPSSSSCDTTQEKHPVRTVAIVLFEGVELMDFAGPAEVFIVADEGKSFKVITVADSLRPIKTMGGITVTPDYTYATVPSANILVIPGGDLSQFSPTGRLWLKSASDSAEIVLSVCYGAYILAKAGLLDGGKATTHHWGLAGLKKIAPACEVISGKRYVQSGKIVTSAGVTSGIDAALFVVEQLLGEEAANWTAKEWMEHHRERPTDTD